MPKTGFDTLHQDDDIIVVNKAPGTLTIPDRFDPFKLNVYGRLKAKHADGNVFIVHRLDKETSGILVFARNAAAHKHLSRQFQEREADKFYLALVSGRPYPAEDYIDRPIGPDPRGGGKMRIDPHGGKPSATAYETVETYAEHTLIRLQLFTGRTHQVRVHMASAGHPLSVDPMYGGLDGLYLSKIKGKKFNLKQGAIERPLLSRVSLHAYQLAFAHPATDERVDFAALPPKDFRTAVKQLGKWSGVESLKVGE